MTRDDLLPPSEVAARYGITPETLSNWRREKKGPRWVKIGDGPRPRVRYRLQDLIEYEQENLVEVGQ